MSSVVRQLSASVADGKHISKRLFLSYILDWIIIIIVAGVGAFLNQIKGNQHVFSLDDISISYPLLPDTVSITVVAIIAFIVPAFFIAILSLVLTPVHPNARKDTPSALVWRRKLWEWHIGWLGLALSLAGTLFLTTGLKDLLGKPRPDLIARCNPNLDAIPGNTVGGLGLRIEESPIMVNVSICQQPNASILNDGFASFPSGHSSFSWAGLLYFSLWLAAKFSVWAPQASSDRASQEQRNPQSSSAGRNDALPYNPVPSRHQSASPPLYLLAMVAAPVIAALYVCATRWADYHHGGFDIIAGSVLGAAFAILSFRYYHLPLHQGWGWSWGPRSRDRAFFAPSWSEGFVGGEGWLSKRHSRDREQYQDIELGDLRPNIASPRPAS